MYYYNLVITHSLGFATFNPVAASPLMGFGTPPKQINFSILEIIGLQNWQRHKLLGSIAMNVLEFFLFGWLYYDVNFLMDRRYYTALYGAGFWAEFWPGFWAGLFGTGPILLCVLVFKHRVKQYSDMKNTRPVIPNFNTPFPA